MIHPRAELLSIWEPVKFENKLSAFKISWWDRQLWAFLFQKGENEKIFRIPKPGMANSITFLGLGTFCGSRLCSLGP